MRTLTTLAGLLAAGLAASACGSSPSETDARTVLRQAKATIDATQSIHFTLSSKDAKGSGIIISGGDGDARRPDQFRGHLTLSENGFSVAVEIVSVNGTFYAQPPFTTTFEKAQPSAYGFGDPGHLLDPQRGLSSLLTAATSASAAGRARIGGVLVDQVDATFPGDRVADLLTSADRKQDVNGRVDVGVDDHRVRQVTLTGPFFDAEKTSTYTLVLDRYGEDVTITPPPGA